LASIVEDNALDFHIVYTQFVQKLVQIWIATHQCNLCMKTEQTKDCDT